MSETTAALRANREEQVFLRRRLHQILESATKGDFTSRIVDIVLILLISVSVVSVILESVPALDVAYADVFYWIETVTVAIFSVEYFLRVWCAIELDEYADSGIGSLQIRLRFIFSPYAMIDFLAILPFYLLMSTA